MPTKGKPQIGCRISEELHERMLEVIAEINEWTKGEPFTVSTFVERAIAEKVAKCERGRGKREQRLPSRNELTTL